MPLGRKHLRRNRDAPHLGWTNQRAASRLEIARQEVKSLDDGQAAEILNRIKECLHSILFMLLCGRREMCMKQADQIRDYARVNYVVPARARGERRFTIRAGDVVRDMELIGGRTPAVCSALKTREFLDENSLQLVSRTGPESGQSTTVIYTYEFVAGHPAGPKTSTGSGGTRESRQAAWEKLRGALKDVYAEYGGGEAYLRAERASFRDADERK
jgi:hypothetical protein